MIDISIKHEGHGVVAHVDNQAARELERIFHALSHAHKCETHRDACPYCAMKIFGLALQDMGFWGGA